MYNNILKNVLDCHKCGLRKQFNSKFHSVTFYYSAFNAKSCRYIMILQNPGIPKDWKNSDEYEILSGADSSNFVKISKKYLTEYLNKKNYNFSNNFFSSLKRFGLINYTDLEDYLKTGIYSDFMVMDAIKCRAETSEIENSHISTCIANHLHREIELYGKNKLVFTFSSRSWENICLRYLNEVKPSERKVSNVHGQLFINKTLPAYFIPLAHFSQRQYNNYLRNSYFQYLEQGLKEYSKRFL